MQGRNGDADVENRLVAPGGKKKVGWIKKAEFCMYTMMCEIDRLWEVADNTGSPGWYFVMT